MLILKLQDAMYECSLKLHRLNRTRATLDIKTTIGSNQKVVFTHWQVQRYGSIHIAKWDITWVFASRCYRVLPEKVARAAKCHWSQEMQRQLETETFPPPPTTPTVLKSHASRCVLRVWLLWKHDTQAAITVIWYHCYSHVFRRHTVRFSVFQGCCDLWCQLAAAALSKLEGPAKNNYHPLKAPMVVWQTIHSHWSITSLQKRTTHCRFMGFISLVGFSVWPFGDIIILLHSIPLYTCT